MMISTGFDRPGGVMAFPGVEKFYTVASRAGGWIVQLWRRIGLALGPATLALALLGASALVFAAPAQAQTISCSGGPVMSTAAKVTYSAVTDTCVISQGGGLSIEAGALTFYMYNNSQHVVQAVRGLGSGNVISGLSVCNFGDGGGNLSPAQCEETNYPDATDLVGTFEWDSTNPGAPGSSDRRMVVNYRRDGSNYTIQSASVTVIGAAAPEINVTGNGNTIADGDTTPTGTDHTLFGNVDVHSGSIERTFTIQNTGTGTLTLGANAVTLSSSGSTAGEFTITQQPATSIAAAGSSTFKVQYDPADFTDDTVTVSVANDDADESPYTFDITGAPIAVEMDVRGNNNDIFNGDTVPSTTDHTDFGLNEVGSGQTFTFEIRNVSAGTLVFGTDAVSISGSSDFTVIAQPPTTLAPGSFNLSTTSFQITFIPSSVGLISATVSIANNDPDESPYTFAIQGTGTAAVTDPEIEVRGNSVAIESGDTTPSTTDDTDFGSVGVGANTARTFTIWNLVNTGGPFLVLGANAVTISGSSDFAVTTQPDATISTGPLASQRTDTVITFTPSSAGLKTATVSINNNDPDENPYTFVIQGTGTGTGGGAPEIAVTGNSVDIADGDTTPDAADDTDFGSANVTTGMVSHTFTITNSGTAILNLGANAASLSGANAADFSITTQPATTVAAGGGSTTVVVQFDPTVVGTRIATLSIASDDADEAPFDFAIQGTGTGAPGDIIIVLSVAGPDTSLGFASATSALNFSLATSGGSAQANVTGVLPGTHIITAANLAASGYVVTDITCSDTDSNTDPKTRTATIVLGSAESVTCTFTLTGSDGVTSQMIVDYLGARNNFILGNQADRTRRIDRLRGANRGSGEPDTASAGVSVLGFAAPFASPVSARFSQNEFSYSARASQIFGYLGQTGDGANLPDLGRWEFWSEGKVSLFDDNSSQSGKFGILHFGADYLVSPSVLVGAKLQIDWMDQRFAATSGKVAGTGYMVGPYATITIDDNFFLDVSGSLGQSSNRISPFGTYTDRFSTTRWMLDGALVGQFEVDNWTIQPTLAAKYISEHQQAYTDTVGFPIAAQTVAQGEFSFSPRLSYNLELDNDTILTPWVEVAGRYGIQSVGSPSAGSFASQLDGLTASFTAGLDVAFPGGASLAISGDLNGIGVAAESYGIRLGLTVPLN